MPSNSNTTTSLIHDKLLKKYTFSLSLILNNQTFRKNIWFYSSYQFPARNYQVLISPSSAFLNMEGITSDEYLLSTSETLTETTYLYMSLQILLFDKVLTELAN